MRLGIYNQISAKACLNQSLWLRFFRTTTCRSCCCYAGVPKLQQASDCCTILRSNKFLHPCVDGFLTFSNEECGFPSIWTTFPKAKFDRGYASVDSQWWLGWASLSGKKVVRKKPKTMRSRPSWLGIPGFFLEVSGYYWSTNPWIIRDEMKWAPTYVNLWYTVLDEDPTTVSDQETTAPATETSESENKKAAGWNGCA